MKYAFIRGHEDQFSIMRICKMMQVSRSGYYAWRDRSESERVIQNRELLQHIHHIHLQSRQAYGAKKTWLALNERGVACGKHRVAWIFQRIPTRLAGELRHTEKR